MSYEEQEPTRVTETGRGREEGGEVRETHPAFGRVVVSRVSSMPGASLFDSEIRHSHYITLTIYGADRTRSLHRDWIHPDNRPKIEIAMSESQWASMVSSFGMGGGTSCTITRTQVDGQVPGIPFASRLAESTDEVAKSADKVKARLEAAVAAVEEKPTKANVRALRHALNGIEPTLTFAATSLTEHTENVVQKARADIEAMVDERAKAVGLPVEHRPQIGLDNSPRHLLPAEEEPPGSR